MPDNNQVQTLVVHVEQLTPENMAQLSSAGYAVTRDPNLLIFMRPVPQPQELALVKQDTDHDVRKLEDNNDDAENTTLQISKRSQRKS